MGNPFICMLVKALALEDIEVPHIRHNFRETSDDKSDWDNLMSAISDGISYGGDDKGSCIP